MTIAFKAPGKLILIGEYAVLENAPALVAAVDRRAEVILRPSADGSSRIDSPTLNFSTPPFTFSPAGEFIFESDISPEIKQTLIFFEAAAKYYKPAELPHGFHFTLNTNKFYSSEIGGKLGLGSSAALVVTLAAAFRAIVSGPEKYKIDKNQIFRDALNIHHAAQGKKGSGIDIAASTYGNLLQFQKNTGQNIPQITPMEKHSTLKLICIWSGKAASTPQMVSKTRQLKTKSPQIYFELMNPLIDISKKACLAYRKNQMAEFCQQYDAYYQQLKLFGDACEADIISRSHREIYKIVKTAGGFYKSSGAGGGDIGIAITTSERIAANIREQILHSPYKIINLEIAPNGVQFSSL